MSFMSLMRYVAMVVQLMLLVGSLVRRTESLGIILYMTLKLRTQNLTTIEAINCFKKIVVNSQPMPGL